MYSSFESSILMKPDQAYLHEAIDEQVGRETRPVCRAFLRQEV